MMIEQEMIIQAYDPQVQIFKLLTHPVRLAILEILRDGEHCVCHMQAHLNLRQAYISQQLSVLREAGIIQDRRDGWNIFYRVVRPEIFQILDATGLMSGQPSLHEELYATDVACPCPQCNGLADQG